VGSARGAGSAGPQKGSGAGSAGPQKGSGAGSAGPQANDGNPLCVALDTSDYARVERLAFMTEPHAGMFKVGLMAFAANGPGLVRSLARMRPVFLDLKLHDIPAQVEGAAAAVAGLGVRWVTVHAAGGPEMMRAAVDAVGDAVTVLAVTVLTSLDDRVLGMLGVTDNAESQVLRMAELALDSGVGGLVCSPLEIRGVRERFGSAAEGGPVLFVPGIRPRGSEAADQRRTMAPREAVEAGADVIVVGRPITGASDPAEAARRIHQEVGG
jgi:orotidine-5'-phosphate decarboxylase